MEENKENKENEESEENEEKKENEKGKESKEKNKIEYYQVKFIIVGNAGVGKTNIYYRFINGYFCNEHEPTILVDYFHQDVKIEDKLFSLQLWDTAGSEIFKSIAKGYYTNAACCLLVYDITKEDSFTAINEWISNIKLYANNKIILILVGNKYDLNEARKVDEEQGRILASQYNMIFFEASAKTGYNIDEIFNKACHKIYENINKELYDIDLDEGVKICKTYKDFEPKKSFYLKNENNDNDKKKKKKKKRRRC